MTAAIVLAGGRSSRLGRDKAEVVVDGRSLLDHTLAACAGLGPVVVVGPPRDLGADLVQVREDPVHGGPVAAIAVALPHVGTAEVLVLACDMPRIADLVPLLVPAGADGDAVVARDRDRVQPLAGRYRVAALRSAVEAGPVEGASMRSVLDRLWCRFVDVPDGCTDDVDTPADLAVLSGGLPGGPSGASSGGSPGGERR